PGPRRHIPAGATQRPLAGLSFGDESGRHPLRRDGGSHRWTRRCLANSASTAPAATEALRLSTSEAMGIDRIEAQFSRTSRDRPLPTEPTTTIVGPGPS